MDAPDVIRKIAFRVVEQTWPDLSDRNAAIRLEERVAAAITHSRALLGNVVPVMQTKHGFGGNCLAACLASIFDCPLNCIPDLAGPRVMSLEVKQSYVMREWLAQMGFTYIELDLAQGFSWTDGAVPDAPCLVAVQSFTPEVAAKGYGHFVVGRVRQENNTVLVEVIHDPNGMQESYKATAVGYFLPIVPRHPSRPAAASGVVQNPAR